MYVKCGCLDYSGKVFHKIQNPSVIPCTSMIVGAAKHGLAKLSLELFQEMTKKRVCPNNVTFIGVLHACSHSGLVDEGPEYLHSIAGRLDEAYKIEKSIQVKPDEGASKWLIESNQQVATAYVTMSNTYALAGKWDNVSIRSEMKRVGVSKESGCSWVEIKYHTYIFYSGDVSSCPRGGGVASLLRELEKKMKERGYVGGSVGLVFVEVEEETKEEMVGLQSERLALGFGLLSMPKGVTIRVMKNLRMCCDCHEAFKLISEIVERDFVVEVASF
ncbi:hypothetical protein ACSBR2_036976 [Camellia fascicularis]